MSAIQKQNPEASAFTNTARRFVHVRRHKHRRDCQIPWDMSHCGKWHKIGSGYYGEAWSHEDFPGLVVKISGPSGWGYEFEDSVVSSIQIRLGEDRPRPDAWPQFAEVCMQNPHPHLPKILHLEKLGGITWGVMPRYTELPGHMYDSAEVKRMKDCFHRRRIAEEWMIPVLDLTRLDYVSVDLHWGNMMLDSKTQSLVIIDPFSSTGVAQGETDRTEFSFSDTEQTESQDTTSIESLINQMRGN